ncbi:HEPN domain-containing protein [Caldivirga maquilingensis]|uniref:HEPN domain protein n=1 Tax=Caldivirga maquilingensis (strain ATCC 700844 / DSM 13496 / JCM 10307 / IC-167) TaxID=397948 RepID=A8MD62_CALMQ|nr:HEPN domain-containing protein [Caldivirga maquilingensis]ABW01718.1 HEPN domain protein [Caldivirga maquilingensis IC-167]
MYDPIDEVKYRYRLAINYFNETTSSYNRRDWRGVAANAQLTAENAVKAIIAVFNIPSWSHDPSNELLSLLNKLPEGVKALINELAIIVRTLAPEHGRSTHGEPSRGLTPWEIYDRGDAERALDMAKRAVSIMITVLNALNISVQ